MIKKYILNSIKDSSTIGKMVVDTFFEKDHSLKASFGNPNGLLHQKNDGFCIDGTRFITLAKARENYLVVAPSGKGKSQVSVFPFLLNAKGNFSIIVNDPSGELATTIPYLESVGYQCKTLNFGHKTGVYFNPLDGCKNNITQMRKVAKTLLRATSEDSDFFTISAEDCLVLFMQYLLESEVYEFQNLANVYRLLMEYQGNPVVVENLLAQKASEDVFRKLRALSGTSENTRKSIIASALAALSFIGDDPNLCDITCCSTINFEDFRIRPHALFVHIPIGDVTYYAPILSIFFQEFYRFAFSQLPSSSDMDIMMILDEFDTLTAIGDFSQIISNSRKFKIPQQIILQSESLLSKYGDKSKNVLNNCGVKTYFGGLGEEAYALEKILGVYEYKDKNGAVRQRSLMSASEIREMKNEIIILPGGEKPLKVPITPAYKQKELSKKLQLTTNSLSEILSVRVNYLNLNQ